MLSIGVETARGFLEQQPFQLAASLSYYTLLSIAPLLLVITGVLTRQRGHPLVPARHARSVHIVRDGAGTAG